MILCTHLRNRYATFARVAVRDDRAAQLVEFAVALPLLVAFVVGIFDFSGAFTLKQKLTNIARDAARAAASDPATDVAVQGTDPIPSSVDDAFQLIDNYLIANHLSDCGIKSGVYISGPGPIWTFSSTGTCPTGGITIIINRGYYFPATTATQPAPTNCRPTTATANQVQVVATCVSIQYAYQWRYGKVASLLGASTALPSTISSVAVAMNED